MKIAFDVQGTLVGHKGEILFQLLEDFKNQGHDVFIWSHSRDMAEDVAKKIGVSDEMCKTKKLRFEYHLDHEIMDIAIDDDPKQKLLVNKIYLVGQLPDTYSELKQFFIAEKILR